jgi:hypothetical protein
MNYGGNEHLKTISKRKKNKNKNKNKNKKKEAKLLQ